MTEDFTKLPPEWFDEDDELVKEKVPREYWDKFGLM
jgi:hypothetical protein